ncbi:radical SAM protein [Desulfosoma sp.]
MGPVIRYLILWLTEACNLRCCYCYRPAVMTPKTMRGEVLEQALGLAARSGRPFHVQLSGGEPTLVPELIEQTAELLRDSGLSYTLGLQTNGTRLTPDLVHLFRRHGIQVGISLDGPPPIHESLRGAFAQTLAGMQLLEAGHVPFRVTTVVSAASVGTLDLLVLLAGGFQWCRGIALDLLTVKESALKGGVAPPGPEALRDGLKRLWQSLVFVNRHRRHPLRLRELDGLLRAKQKSTPSPFCHAARGESLAVRPDGAVFPCGQVVGEERLACGTVWDVDAGSLASLCGKDRPRGVPCRTCPVQAFCPGECPSRLSFNAAHHGALVCTMYQTLWQLWQEFKATEKGLEAVGRKDSRGSVVSCVSMLGPRRSEA